MYVGFILPFLLVCLFNFRFCFVCFYVLVCVQQESNKTTIFDEWWWWYPSRVWGRERVKNKMLTTTKKKHFYRKSWWWWCCWCYNICVRNVMFWCWWFLKCECDGLYDGDDKDILTTRFLLFFVCKSRRLLFIMMLWFWDYSNGLPIKLMWYENTFSAFATVNKISGYFSVSWQQGLKIYTVIIKYLVFRMSHFYWWTLCKLKGPQRTCTPACRRYDTGLHPGDLPTAKDQVA